MDDPTTRCGISCATHPDGALNRDCGCHAVDVPDVIDRLMEVLPSYAGLDASRHAHLFSPYAFFVDRRVLVEMAAVAHAVFAAARLPGYVERVLGYAPESARRDPGSPGGVLGIDFHLTADGPRLIEINTNPGGLLLNAALLDAVRACTPGQWHPWATSTAMREAAINAWLADFTLQRGGRMPERIAIVDATPMEQFLAPEFELYAQGFRARGMDVAICGPEELMWESGCLLRGGQVVDSVYNRLTDFALTDPASSALSAAWETGAIAMSPHPRAHAIFADKRNLALLGDGAGLQHLGMQRDGAQRLAGAIPATTSVTPETADRLWRERDRYFFKPAAGFGSRGSYRGAKITKRVWETILQGGYVAQAFAPPSLRVLGNGQTLKADVRCYATADDTIGFAARLYQGQTTNMRTPGGGFAAVLTTDKPAALAGSV